MFTKDSIQARILKANILNIVLLVLLIGILFNISIGIYIQNQTISQFNEIAQSVQGALRNHPNKFPEPTRNRNTALLVFGALDRVLKNYTSILDAQYILINNDKIAIPTFENTLDEIIFNQQLLTQIPENHFDEQKNLIAIKTKEMNYMGMIIPILNARKLQLGWVIIYSDTSKVNSLRIVINVILIAILFFSMALTIIYSIYTSKKISRPFSVINQHLNELSKRNFHKTIHIEANDEIIELIHNINFLSQKLRKYEEDQATFLQNISHELRTPLMSIQSYAEGIKYHVVEDHENASDIIIQETKRITDLVEQLTYLSRIDTVEGEYHFETSELDGILWSCIDCVKGIALKNNKKIVYDTVSDTIKINADPEKLSRAIINILSNCIRHAKTTIAIKMETQEDKVIITIEDDGEGFLDHELQNIFTRFYKGQNGHLGIGLAITKEVIDAHHAEITAENSSLGALFIIHFPR
ncbi:sensor histidine kinase [Cellulosilyticum sp. I15G10I2]|uniref:sensor histidine kinase n=1 Tax=Cellulosilyticum sp. I15G10I2 TaxID=1892843 RepID=UPI00085C1ED1|nr:HAMP domain-containing sensor histidine kinase [Cellulosilyticum sp. I15G10I2]